MMLQERQGIIVFMAMGTHAAHHSIQVLVLNSHGLGGSWGTEERPSGYPFSPGAFTVVTIVARDGYFEIDVNNGGFTYNYTYRAPVSRITRVAYDTARSPPLDNEKLILGKVCIPFQLLVPLNKINIA